MLDVVGLALAGSETPFGNSTRAASLALSSSGPSRIWGTGERVAASTAAFANAAFAQALEFDDTHNESIVHMSSPAVAAALAIAEEVRLKAGTTKTVRLKADTTNTADTTKTVHLKADTTGADTTGADTTGADTTGADTTGADTRRVSGRELIVAIALANEISSRVGSVAPGQFHRRGFHPTGLFAPFGITYLAGKLLGLDQEAMARAAGICGSVAAGLLECWVDGTQTRFLQSGWAAQSGIAAAALAGAGVTGPPTVFEGRFGFFASHLQQPDAKKNFDRIAGGLGDVWESRNASFKPYPAAHVLHPYVDAVLRAREQHRISSKDVMHIDCPVAEFNVSIVCEPLAEKLAPASDSHARISLQYTLAEALHEGKLGRSAYSPRNLHNPAILALAQRVRYYVDPDFPGPGRFKGAVRIALHDGRVITDTQEHNLGSPENPMTAAQLRAKFDENAEGVLSAAQRDRLVDTITRLEELDDASVIVDASISSISYGTPSGVP